MNRIIRALRARRLLKVLGYPGDALRALEELDRRRRIAGEYRRWLAEFPDIGTALDNMEAEGAGKPLSVSYPPDRTGPWAISRLREVLRGRRRPMPNADSIMALVTVCCEEAWRMGRRGDYNPRQVTIRDWNDRLRAVRAALEGTSAESNSAPSAAGPVIAEPSSEGSESATVGADLIPAGLSDAKCDHCKKVWKVTPGWVPPPCVACGGRVRFSLSAVKT